jgi:putative transposase
MPRRARVVFAGVPHHVTQRGNHRERVFFSDSDCVAYQRLLKEHADRYGVEVVAYCLMFNHVHIVAVPGTSDSLHRFLKSVNGHYAQRINRMREAKGHLWQGRFFSSPLDSDYLFNAVRYVELNPIRARIVARAEEYAWSSARAHCGIGKDPVVAYRPDSVLLGAIGDWSGWLAGGIPSETIDSLRLNGSQNLPCGSIAFIAELEAAVGRNLRYRARGAQPRDLVSRDQRGTSPLNGTLPFKGERPL